MKIATVFVGFLASMVGAQQLLIIPGLSASIVADCSNPTLIADQYTATANDATGSNTQTTAACVTTDTNTGVSVFEDTGYVTPLETPTPAPSTSEPTGSPTGAPTGAPTDEPSSGNMRRLLQSSTSKIILNSFTNDPEIAAAFVETPAAFLNNVKESIEEVVSITIEVVAPSAEELEGTMSFAPKLELGFTSSPTEAGTTYSPTETGVTMSPTEAFVPVTMSPTETGVTMSPTETPLSDTAKENSLLKFFFGNW